MPERWRDRAFRPGQQDASGQAIAEVLPAHDAETTSSSKAQYRLGKQVNRVRYDKYVASLEQLPETTPPRGTGDPSGEKETRGPAKARQGIQSGPGATAFLRARPADSSRVIPASEFVSAGRRGDGGVSGNEVPLMWCNGRKHAARTIVSSIGCAGQTAPTPSLHASPAPLSGRRSATRWKAELLSTPRGTFEWTW